MSTSDHYDVIIIGSGAGGGTLAYKLAGTGKNVLLLERGGYLKRERDNWSSKAIYLDGKYHTSEEWLDRDDQPFRPGAHYFVGGNTKAYGAVLFRLRDTDFGEVRHADGISPAWPISYHDLEPYYADAERLYLVHGKAGEDHTEPSRSGEFPHPPVSHEPRIQQLSDDMARVGLHPFHLPIGIDLDESDPEGSRCIRCDRFDGFPCVLEGKADAHVCAVRPALAHDNVKLLTHAKVERLETDASGHTVTGVVVERDGGGRETYRGDLVVVSCGAVNSAALLLRSASDAHPNGLANASGVVGRHYMCHLNTRGDRGVEGAERHGVREDARLQRLLLRSRRLRLPARPHPDAGEERPRHPEGRGAAVHAGLHARLHRQARDRPLADERGPAAGRRTA